MQFVTVKQCVTIPCVLMTFFSNKKRLKQAIVAHPKLLSVSGKNSIFLYIIQFNIIACIVSRYTLLGQSLNVEKAAANFALSAR